MFVKIHCGAHEPGWRASCEGSHRDGCGWVFLEENRPHPLQLLLYMSSPLIPFPRTSPVYRCYPSCPLEGATCPPPIQEGPDRLGLWVLPVLSGDLGLTPTLEKTDCGDWRGDPLLASSGLFLLLSRAEAGLGRLAFRAKWLFPSRGTKRPRNHLAEGRGTASIAEGLGWQLGLPL